MKSKKIIIGSRGSKLALIYAEKAKEKILKVSKELNIESVEIKKITTAGDLNQKDRLSEIGGKGLFSNKIEKQLLENKIDIAVHALKDMPSDETEGLLTNCFLERNDPREVLISKNKIKFKDLNQNSIIGTSSFRREFQLKNKRSDLNYKSIRGNVDTRINKLNQNLYDAVVLSYAGINSLNLDEHISEIFSIDEIIPSAGQGVIALQCKSDDEYIKNILKKINDEKTFKSAQAERNVLKVEVIKEAYLDKTDKSGRFVAVTVKFKGKLPKPVTLENIKNNKELSHLGLIKQSRLSVMPVDSKSWKIILKMSSIDKK